MITDFNVETSRVDAQELAAANRGFSVAVQPIASVIGSVSALYNSKFHHLVGNILPDR